MRSHFARAGRFGLRFLSSFAFRKPWKSSTRNQLRPKPVLEILEARAVPAVVYPQYVLVPHAGGVQPLYTTGPTGLTPTQVRHAYGFDQISFSNGTVAGDGTGETIAIVDAYDDPTAASDLIQFDAAFSLPNPTFTKVNQTGGSKMPTANSGWATEIALDVEWSHAIAPKANILLVEANSSGTSDLFTAVRYAAAQSGVVAVSMSWGGGEYSGETFDSTFTTPSGHAGVTFVASSGDSGAPTSYPSASPNVLSVGGTTLSVNSSGTYLGESAWSGSGGGISAIESQPSYQKGIVTQTSTNRADPDVSYDANPNTGFPVYDSYTDGTSTPWVQVGGTSDAAPQWAALIAIVDQGLALKGIGPLDGPSQTLPKLYQLPSGDFHDITSGSSTGTPNYAAGPGYDLATGLGSPIANLIVSDLTSVTAQPRVLSQGTMDWNGDGVADLFEVQQSGTASGYVEINIMDGASGYQKSLAHIVTPLAEAPAGTYQFLFGPYNGDGKPDLYVIAKANTGSGNTEVHVLSATSGYQTWLLHTAIPLPQTGSNFEFRLGDYDGDGKSDLFVIIKSGTGSGDTEVHVLSGASNFQTWLLHTALPLGQTGSNFDFEVGAYNGDGRPDLYVIITSGTGSGMTEVHVLSAANNYQTWLLHTATPLAPVGPNFQFQVADYNGDGAMDLIVFVLNQSGSGKTEVHVLDGANQFQTWDLHTATGLPMTTDDSELLL